MIYELEICAVRMLEVDHYRFPDKIKCTHTSGRRNEEGFYILYILMTYSQKNLKTNIDGTKLPKGLFLYIYLYFLMGYFTYILYIMELLIF